MPNTKNHFMLSETSYNIGKKLVQVVLPAFASLYFGLASIWGLPAAEEVVGTLAVITTFLGVTLGISTRQYEASGAAYDGSMIVTTTEDGPKTFTLEIDEDPEELEKRDSITFKVSKADEYTGGDLP